MFGYIGKLLFVDLTTGAFEVRDLDEQMAHDYIGGHALGARILWDEMPAYTPWDAPESVLGFVTGPINGTTGFYGMRYTVVSKCPANGLWNDANSGGSFGPALKKAGYDAVFVKGKAEKPVYIYIKNGVPEIRDASHLWGKMVMESENILYDELGKQVHISLIGPAGENLSHIAAIMNDQHRACGRGGTGAVMGSKKLKALVVEGNTKVECFDKKMIIEHNKWIADQLKGPKANVMKGSGTYGTPGNYVANLLMDDASTKNWSSSAEADFTEEQARKLCAQTMDPIYKVAKYHCDSCPVGCGAIYSLESERWPTLKHAGRPEYESCGAFGSMLLNDDAEAMITMNHLCNEYGFDTISAGATLAWGMEAYDNGLFTQEWFDGIDYKWGDGAAACEVLDRMGRNEGNCAKLLLNGSFAAADYLGAGFEYLTGASRIEFSQHDPRLTVPYVRTFQYDPSPGRHTKGGRGAAIKKTTREQRQQTRGTAFLEAQAVVTQEIVQATGYCNFHKFVNTLDGIFKTLKGATGFEYTKAERYMLGLRMYYVRLAFNLREGKRRADYTITDRIIGKPPMTTGNNKGVTVDNEYMADQFFTVIGCDMNFVPYKETLEMIGGLDFLIDELYNKQQ